MGLIKDLYDGQIYPAEQIISRDPEYHDVGTKISAEKGYFEGLLSSEDWTRLEHLHDLLLAQSIMYAYQNFSYGFKLGIRLMHEVNMGINGPDEES